MIVTIHFAPLHVYKRRILYVLYNDETGNIFHGNEARNYYRNLTFSFNTREEITVLYFSIITNLKTRNRSGKNSDYENLFDSLLAVMHWNFSLNLLIQILQKIKNH